MIWRVVVVVICIVIVVSAVWAASNSFEVRVDSPNVYDDTVIILTPTPAPLAVNHPFAVDRREIGRGETLRVDVPVPNGHVVLMNGNQDNGLSKFHLCRGVIDRCSGGILSVKATFIDWQGDGLADRLRVYFRRDQLAALLGLTSELELLEDEPSNSTADSTPSMALGRETNASANGTVEPTIDVNRQLRLTLSGDIFAWRTVPQE